MRQRAEDARDDSTKPHTHCAGGSGDRRRRQRQKSKQTGTGPALRYDTIATSQFTVARTQAESSPRLKLSAQTGTPTRLQSSYARLELRDGASEYQDESRDSPAHLHRQRAARVGRAFMRRLTRPGRQNRSPASGGLEVKFKLRQSSRVVPTTPAAQHILESPGDRSALLSWPQSHLECRLQRPAGADRGGKPAVEESQRHCHPCDLLC